MENTQNLPEPSVRVMGEEVSRPEEKEEHKCSCGRRQDASRWREWRHCNRHAGNAIWGLALALGGILLLFNNAGLVSWQVWQFIWPFWPVILILIGLRFILGFNWVSGAVVFLVAAAAFAYIILSALIQVNSPLVNSVPKEIIDFVSNYNLTRIKGLFNNNGSLI